MMAVEDNLDQLYALFIANSIMCSRMWAYLATVGATSEGIPESAFLERHIKMSAESVDLWDLEGHPDPERIRRMAKEAIKSALGGIIRGASGGSPLQ